VALTVEAERDQGEIVVRKSKRNPSTSWDAKIKTQDLSVCGAGLLMP